MPPPCQDRDAAVTDGLLHFRSPVSFALLIAAIFLFAFNLRFWRAAALLFWHGSLPDALFLLSLGIALLWACASALLLIPGGVGIRIAAGLLFPLGATAAFCADSFGLAIDGDMVRSFTLADQREALALLNSRLLCYALLLGVLPQFIVGEARIACIGARRHLLHRLAFIAAGIPLLFLLMLPFQARFAQLMREHRDLGYYLVPAAALRGLADFARSDLAAGIGNANASDLIAGRPEALPRRLASKADQRPLLVFLVLGETARHASFQLGSYARPTNPRLSAMENLFYFRDVVSCGTSTAVSIPCIFSSLGQQGYSVAKAEKQPNLLDELVAAGIHVTWRTNNSGGADVHARIPVIDFTRQRQPQWCDEESCHDEILLHGLQQQLRSLSGDSLIVFHQMGSHGPAYDRRYPMRARTFQPTCAGNDPLLCSAEALRNSYDNSIVYTDMVLAEQIGLLKQASDRFDTALIYVSDHGESLGERGIYLHGAPRGIAPDEQKHIPFFIWMSPAYMQRMRIDAACLRRDLGKRFSHDNLYHTVLGAMALRNDAYREDMDMLEACRKDGG